jgi:hypothetical protein
LVALAEKLSLTSGKRPDIVEQPEENTNMKTSRMLCLCAAIALPQFALAAEPSLNKKSLGQVEGIVDFCAKVNPQIAKSKGMATPSVFKASQKDLEDARNSDEYKEAYDAITVALTDLPQEQVSEACSAAVAPKK